MKYFLILTVACSPLLILAGSSVADLLRAPTETALEIKPVDVKSAEELAAATLEQAKPEKPVVELLMHADLFDAGPQEDPLCATGLEGFEKVLEAWKNSRKTRAWIAEYAASELPKSTDLTTQAMDEKSLAAQVDKLQKFLDQQAKRKDGDPIVASMSPVMKMLETQKTAIDRERQDIENKKLVAATLQEARDALKINQPDKCVNALGRDHMRTATDSAVKKEIEQLTARAEYRLVANGLLSGLERAPTLDDFDRFIQRPEPVPEGEENKRVEVVEARAKLSIEIKLAELGRLNDFEGILSGSEDILKDPLLKDDTTKAARDYRDGVHDKLRVRVRDWLTTTAMTKVVVPPILEGKAEILLTSKQKRKIGVFEDPSNGASTYKFWKSAGARAANPKFSSEPPIRSDSFEGKPRVPTYLYLANSYNNARDTLISDSDSADGFLEFEKKCITLQSQLDKYRADHSADTEFAEYDTACNHFNFKKPAAAAQQVAENWSRYRVIIGN